MRNIVILGMHRSGTSMVSGALVKCGLYAGESDDLLITNADNPHGFWERSDVVDLNDRLLQAFGGSWFDPVAVPAEHALLNDELQVDRASIVSNLPDDIPWLVKDPRMAVTWPYWRESLKNSLIVYVYRSPLAVANSLKKRNGFPLQMGLALWEFYNRCIVSELRDRPFAAISFEQFAESPDDSLHFLITRLTDKRDFELSAGLAHDVFDHSLGTSGHQVEPELAALLTPSQRALAACCTQICATNEWQDVPEEADDFDARRRDLSHAMEPLSDAREVRVTLEERTLQRNRTLQQLSDLEQRYEALVKAHKQEIKRHKKLAGVYQKLTGVYETLLEEHAELRTRLEKADVKAALLDDTFSNLLSFEQSFLGKLSRWTRKSYRALTLQRGRGSSYETALDDAYGHAQRLGFELPQSAQQPRPGKVAMAHDVVRYVLNNPAGSARSFSYARLKRAASVFFRSSPDDLKVWIDSRFPDTDSQSGDFDVTNLDASLDELSLVFPSVDSPRVSIVVPVYNDYRVTMNCLESILRNTSDTTYEVILADDHSSDLTASIQERVANLRVVRGAENLGFLRNCNHAATTARGEHLLFLNNDTAVCDNWLEPLVELLDARQDVGIVGPKLLFADGKLQEAGGIMWRDGSAWNYGRSDSSDKPEYNYVREVDYISGACLLIRGQLWREIGGFDERFVPAYYEDSDIAFAVRESGYKVMYQPLSCVFHYEGVSNGTDLTSGIKQHQVVNQSTFRNKWAQVLDRDHLPNAREVFRARDRSRGRRTVLFLDHYVPHHDKDAGSRSTLQYVQLMVEMGYQVLFMGANFFPHQPYTRQLQQMGVQVLVGEHIARNLDRWLAENAQYIDNIYIHRPHVAEQFLGNLEKMNPRPKLIFFGHDLHYLRAAREYELTGDRSVQKSSKDWKKREFAVFDRVDTVYYPSQVEVDEVLSNRSDLNIQAIPLYALPDTALPSYEPGQRTGILFVGGFNHPPNVDAIKWFVDEVMPLVLLHVPDIQLHVVGSNPTESVQELQSEHVQVYGYLTDEELAAMYSQIRLSVVPLRFGAGVKGKVIEAIQHAVPLVTTPVGAEGIPEAEKVMHVAHSAKDFADYIIAIEQGDLSSLEKLKYYADWLQAYFSKARAREVVLKDFGEPRRNFHD
ncbi:MAG: glycosyltransferase [Halioglobus sp.]